MPLTSPRRAVAVAALTLVPCATAQAIVIYGEAGTANPAAHYAAPAHEPGWANVGSTGSTAVYLGNRYVLTAAHAGAGSLTLASGTFAVESGSAVRLKSPAGSGDSAETDLLLYRLTSDPGLPSLRIAAATPVAGEQLTLIGAGRERGSALKSYSFGTPPAAGSGYDWAGTRTKAWGYNTLNATGKIEVLDRTVYAFSTRFDAAAGEAQAAGNDSGGAVFNAARELAGILIAVGPYPDQPANTALVGNLTYAADLSVYRDQIVSAIPEPTAAALLVPAGLAGLRRRRRL